MASASAVPNGNALRNHIVQVAGGLFYKKGIRAVGVDEIIAEADIAKATLYRHFRSKEDIVVACLLDRKSRLEAMFRAKTSLSGDSPADQILAVFKVLAVNLQAPDFRGCAFLMAVAEHGESGPIREAARSYKLFIRNQLHCLLQGKYDGSEVLADQLSLIYEGAVATAVLRPESEPGLQAYICAELLLSAQSETPPSPKKRLRLKKPQIGR